MYYSWVFFLWSKRTGNLKMELFDSPCWFYLSHPFHLKLKFDNVLSEHLRHARTEFCLPMGSIRSIPRWLPSPLFARPRKKICGWGRGLARQWSPDWLAPTKQSFWSHAQMVVNFVLLYQSSLQIGSAKLLDLLIHSNVRRNFSLPFCYCSSLGEYRSVRCR